MSIAAGEHGRVASWQHPFRNGDIRIPTDSVRTISAEALRWLLAQPSCEIGGILWGSFEGESVFISDAQFVFSENSYFNETSADATRLEEAIARKQRAGLSLIGYFRSHIRDGLSLSNQDQKLIEAHLRDTRSVFLLVRPFQMGICMGAFFFWENGRLQTDVSDLEVPFVALDQAAAPPDIAPPLPADLPPQQVEAPAAAATLAPVKQPTPEMLNPEQTLSPSGRGRLVSTLAAAVLLGTGTAWVTHWAARAFRQQSAATDLQVSRRADGQLDLTWSPNASRVAFARAGTVTIRDGSSNRTITLDRAQLRFGKLAYFPQSDDVEFRLDLETLENRRISESLHVLPPSDKTSSHLSEKMASYQPPRPLHQVMPNAEILQPIALSEGARARIQVEVNTDGNVTFAEALKEGTTASGSLVNSAVSAARQWTFSPATLDGKPVAARHTIVFQFDRPSR